MKPIKKSEMNLGSIDPVSDLEWMLQSEQISDSALIRVLVHDFYPRIFRLALFYLGDYEDPIKLRKTPSQNGSQQNLSAAAREVTEQALLKVVMNRHRYWGAPELNAWIFGLAFRTIQKSANIQQSDPTNPTQVSDQMNGGTVQYDPELGKSVSLLDKRQRLVLLLRYSYHLDIPGIAHILKASEKSVLANLRTTRETVWEKLGINEQKQGSASPIILHRYIHRQLHADIDGYSRPGEKETILEHLKECPACQGFAAELESFEKRFSGYLKAIWPDPVFAENEESIVQIETTHRLENGGFRRKISINVKEGAIIGLVILAVIAIGWGIKIMAPNADLSASASSQLGVSSIQSFVVTPTLSFSDPGALPTNDPGSERAWFNSSAITPPKAFIDLNHTVSITDPVTDTNDINQSGIDSLEVLMRHWGSIETVTDEYQQFKQGVNMTPFQIVRYINSNTNLKAFSRVSGDIETIKHFLSAGFPVIIERGYDGASKNGLSNWIGTFNVVNGFDDAQQMITMVYSYKLPGVYVGMYYGSFVQQWRAFDYEYLVIYKPDQQEMVDQILGSQADANQNYRQASEKASMDAYNSIYVRDQFFAWFNLGTTLTYLRKYSDAVSAYDQAFDLYKKIPESELPWRIFWYQTDFYQAYYATGRYQDVINLATMIINGPGSPQTEDSYYWRALAEEALGNKTGEILDLQASLKINQNFDPGRARLSKIINGG